MESVNNELSQFRTCVKFYRFRKPKQENLVVPVPDYHRETTFNWLALTFYESVAGKFDWATVSSLTAFSVSKSIGRYGKNKVQACCNNSLFLR